MRFEDLARAIDESRSALEAEEAACRPARAEAGKLYGMGKREWDFPINLRLTFNTDLMLAHLRKGRDRATALACGLYLTHVDWELDSPRGMSSASTLQIALAIRHVEQWVAGQIDELLPSGTWITVGASLEAAGGWSRISSGSRSDRAHDPDPVPKAWEAFLTARTALLRALQSVGVPPDKMLTDCNFDDLAHLEAVLAAAGRP